MAASIAPTFRCKYKGEFYVFPIEPDDSLLCAVCKSLADEPRQSLCCGKTSCTSCLPNWTAEFNETPECRHGYMENADLFRDTRAKQTIESLKVYCPNTKNGCCRLLELSKVNQHLAADDGCQFHRLSCPNYCGRKTYRLHLKHHVANSCELRLIKCKYCKNEFPFRSYKANHENECPSFPLPCPNNCGEKGLVRSSISSHRLVCPLEVIDCQHRAVGCSVRVARKDLIKHMSDGREHHHILTKKCLLATKMKLSATEDQLVATEAEMSSTKDHLMDTEKQLTATEGKIVELKLTVERVARQLLMLQGLTQPPNMQ